MKKKLLLTILGASALFALSAEDAVAQHVPQAEKFRISTQGAEQPLPPPRPTGYWEKTWGAIAPSPVGGVVGTAVGASSKHEAERIALEDCVAKGGGACQVDVAYHNQCAVMVMGDTIFNTVRAGSIEEAGRIGVQQCEKDTDNCKVYYSACTDPIFHKY